MAAIDDLQFDMAAALVAVMVVLFDLVHEDIREPQNPSPGTVQVDMLFLEEPVRPRERSLLPPPTLGTFGGGPSIVLDWPMYTADGSAGGFKASELSCGIAGDTATRVYVSYEGSDSENRATATGEPVEISARLERYGIKVPPHEEFFSVQDISRDQFLDNAGIDQPSATFGPDVWPKYYSDRKNGYILDIVVEGERVYDLAEFHAKGLLRRDDRMSREYLNSWEHSSVDEEDRIRDKKVFRYIGITPTIRDRLDAINGGNGTNWLDDPQDPWLLAAFLPFRPFVHLSCEASGDGVVFGTNMEVSVAAKGCGGSSICESAIRPLHLIAVRAMASFREESLVWHAGSREAPPLEFSPAHDSSGLLPRVHVPTTLALRLDD